MQPIKPESDHEEDVVEIDPRKDVSQRGYLSYASNTKYTKYLNREDQGWASVKVGKPYRPLGKPILDYQFQRKKNPQDGNGKDGKQQKRGVNDDITEENKPKPVMEPEESAEDDDSVRALLQLCNPRRMQGRIESSAIKQRLALAEHRIRTVKTGGKLTLSNEGNSDLEQKIAEIDQRLRAPPSRSGSNTKPSQRIVQQIRESHQNTPAAQWQRFAEVTRTRAAQSASTLAYFTPRGVPKPGAGQILRQVRRAPMRDDDGDDEGMGLEKSDHLAKTAPKKEPEGPKPLQTLARCYADFDLTKNDLRERLLEGLSMMASNRDQIIHMKYNSFVPSFTSPEIDIYDMRDEAELSRHHNVVKRHRNYAWLHLLVQFADKRAAANGAEMPIAEEVETIHKIASLVECDEALDINLESFRKIVLAVDPPLLHVKEVRALLSHVQTIFGVTKDQYTVCLQEAGFEDDDMKYRFKSRGSVELQRQRPANQNPYAPSAGAQTSRKKRGPNTSRRATAQDRNSTGNLRTPRTARLPGKPRLVVDHNTMEYHLQHGK